MTLRELQSIKLHHGMIALLAAAAFSTACSSRYGVGVEPGEGGTGGGDTAGSSGSSSGSGNTSSAGTSSAGTSSMADSGSGGEGGAAVGQRCGFAPDTDAVVEARVTTDAVVERIGQFLEGTPQVTLGDRPATPTPAWAAELATQILDEHFAAGTEAPGLAAFLEAWLDIPESARPSESAHAWAIKLVDPGATLATLLAEPTGDPHRLGILTASDVLATRGGISQRGYWMNERLFCRVIPVSPPDVAPLPIPGADSGTRRERLAEHVSPGQCQACHAFLDPPAYSLEHFDETGAYREIDAGKPVNSSGSIVDPTFDFSDFASLAPQLAESCVVAQCFSKAVATHATPTTASLSKAELNHVANAFAESNFSIRELVKAVVSSPAFFR